MFDLVDPLVVTALVFACFFFNNLFEIFLYIIFFIIHRMLFFAPYREGYMERDILFDMPAYHE